MRKKRMKFLINKTGFYYQQKLRKRTSKDYTYFRKEEGGKQAQQEKE